MRCGDASVVLQRKQFSWYPPWVNLLILAGLLPLFFVALVVTKRVTVYAPFCDEHRNHWVWRTSYTRVGLALVILFGVASVSLLANLPRDQWFPAAGLVYGGGVIAVLVWLLSAATIHSLSIHPKEITDHDITFINVSAEFKEALLAERYDREIQGWFGPPPLPRQARPAWEDPDDEAFWKRER
jgi:hypothetical protein